MKKNDSGIFPHLLYSIMGRIFLTFFLLTAASCRHELLYHELYFYQSVLPVITTNIQITGSLIDGGDLPVRAYFTDGAVADGYIDSASGAVMLFDDGLNEQETGKIFHTLSLLGRAGAKKILIGRKFDGETIDLNIDGSGELDFRSGNPVPIGTVEEFERINTDPAYMAAGAHYVQTHDLDLLGAPTTWNGVLAPARHHWTPIGNGGIFDWTSVRNGGSFDGTFDGADKEITNLYINLPSAFYLGLFSVVGSGGTVKNVHVKSGTVLGDQFVGGIAGRNENGTLRDCSNEANVTGHAATGGVAGGVTQGGYIISCRNTGAVTGTGNNNQQIGGVAGGCTYNAVVTACSNEGPVSAQYMTGGVVGYNVAIVTACRNSGPVSGLFHIGGVVGLSEGYGGIAACYNTGTVTGGYSGGIAGNVASGETISACYNTGTVTGGTSGGIAGYGNNGSTISACYWLASSASDNVGTTYTGALEATSFSDEGSFTDVSAEDGWETGDGSADQYWKVGTTTGGQLPKLWWEAP